METFSQLLDLWATRQEVAEDCGVEYGSVNQWHRRNSIPSKYWANLIAGAQKRGIQGVSYETLTVLASDTAPQPQSGIEARQ
jgi:hypothetical protein